MQPTLEGFEPSTFDNPLYRTFKNTTILTIGHGDHLLEEFTAQLKKFGVDRLVDVRSKPYSRRYPQFNREALTVSLAEVDLNYDFRGNNLGGLGENVRFDETIDELAVLAKTETIALCCSESDFKKCHRYRVLAPEFLTRGIDVKHIRYDDIS